MISCRADLFKKLKPASLIGLKPLLVPTVTPKKTYKGRVLVKFNEQRDIYVDNVDNGGVIWDMREFLGTRDGYAFFLNSNGAPFVGKILKIEDQEGDAGRILSLKNGIYKTDKGLSLNAEDYGFWKFDEDSVTV